MTKQQSETVKWASIKTANNEVSSKFTLDKLDKCSNMVKEMILHEIKTTYSIGFK